MKKILLAAVFMFLSFSISEGKSWEKYFYDLLTSTNASIKIVDEQGRVLTMDGLGIVISSNVSFTVISQDERYAGKVSTGTAGKISASGNISPDNEVVNISFLTEGGNAQITCTFRSGIIYIREGIPASINVPALVDNPTFQCTLDPGTTLYYISDEVD